MSRHPSRSGARPVDLPSSVPGVLEQQGAQASARAAGDSSAMGHPAGVHADLVVDDPSPPQLEGGGAPDEEVTFVVDLEVDDLKPGAGVLVRPCCGWRWREKGHIAKTAHAIRVG